MAYNFVSASSRYISSAAPMTGTPCTIAGWCRPNDSIATGSICYLGQSSSNHRSQLFVQNNTIGVYAEGASSSIQINGSTTTNFSNTWLHAAGVFSSSNARQIFRNGVADTDVNTAQVGIPNTANSCLIGARYADGVAGRYFDGMLAEIGVWNAALTANEIAALAAGITPEKIRPQSLVFYAPLVRDLVDLRGGLTITNNNSATVANHPRVYA